MPIDKQTLDKQTLDKYFENWFNEDDALDMLLFGMPNWKFLGYPSRQIYEWHSRSLIELHLQLGIKVIKKRIE